VQGAVETNLKIGGVEAMWLGTVNGKSAALVVAGPTADGLGASVTLTLMPN
jgi:hypothetical protein